MNREKINEIIKQNTEEIIEEIYKDDKRFKENKDVELSKSNLGQLGQVLDSVFNPYREYDKSLEEIYAEYLDCDVKDLTQDSKYYTGYRTNILKYCIHNMTKYKKEVFLNSNSKEPYESKSFDIIRTSVEKETRVPRNFHIGLKKGNDKFIIKTRYIDFGLEILFFYKKGNSKPIDDFIKYIDQKIVENNFYKGKKISPSLEFLKLGDVTWDDVILKDEIKNNKLFFKRKDL